MKKKTFNIFFWVLIVIAAGSLGYIGYHFTTRYLELKHSEELADQVFVNSEDTSDTESGEKSTQSETADPEENDSLGSDPMDTDAENASQAADSEESSSNDAGDGTNHPYVCPLDFDYLQSINPDIYAWIVINHMDISYPILQREGNDTHYLVYDYRDYAGDTGAIYTHDENTKDFTDFNTVIYGHNLYQGGMFTDVEQYRDSEFLQEHRDIEIYTPTQGLHYRVFACVAYSDVLLDYKYNWNIPEDCTAFLESLNETDDLSAQVLDDIEVTNQDHIITLSTCVSGIHDHRLLVCAVLTRVEDLDVENNWIKE